MADHPLNKQRLYVTDADVMALPPIRPTDQVVAVLAPQGTTLEVPEPDQGLEQGARRYRCAAALLESWLPGCRWGPHRTDWPLLGFRV